MARGDRNLLVGEWFLICLYLYEVLPIAIVSQYVHHTVMT